MSFKSFSQAGQDKFVHKLLCEPSVNPALTKYGFFLDIGCSHPTEINNTYAFELSGWSGILIDFSKDACELCMKERQVPVLQLDMTLPNIEFWTRLPAIVDYASFDLDENTLSALTWVPWVTKKFRVMTVEHDAYRFGQVKRKAIRYILESSGYRRVCSDVTHQGMPFEDWWIHPELVPDSKWRPLVSEGKECGGFA